MKAIYNDNLTIETRDDPNERNLRECRAYSLDRLIFNKNEGA